MNKLATSLFKLTSGTRSLVDAVKRGWKQEWARGNDLAGGSSGSVQLTQAAQQSAWVFRCLQLIAGPIRSLPLEFYAMSGREQMQLDDPELAAWWARPAVTSGEVPLGLGDFIELSCHWIGLKGQAVWILDDSWITRGGVKNPIILARTDRLTPIRAGNVLLGWQFSDGFGRHFNLLPQQVIRPRFLNPYDDAEGLAPLDAAWIAAQSDHAAGLFSRNLSQSNGDQGVYVISKGGVLNPEQQQQIIAQLRQKSALAKRGEFRAAFLTGDVSIEDPKLKSVDAAFLQGRQFNRDEIAAAFGVPCSMLQKMDSYSIGAASDRYRLIEETCIPMSDRLTDAIAHVERLRTGRDLIAVLDWDEHSVLSQVRNEKFKTASDIWKTGVPWDVLNDTMDLGLDPFPGSDKAWLPMNLEAVEGSAITPSLHDSTSEDPTATEELQALMQRHLKTLDGLIEKVGTRCAASEDSSLPHTKANEARAKLWRAHMAARRPAEKLFLSKFRKVLMTARKETLTKIESTDKALAGVRQRGVLDLIFNLSQFTLSLVSEMTKAHEAAIDDATKQFLLEIARPDDPWTMESGDVLRFLARRENLIRDAAAEVHQQILDTLQQGLDAGETTAQLAARVKAEFNSIADERAVMIAQTETGAAYGATRHQAIQDLDVPFKEWVSAQDDRVRDTHRQMDGVVLPSDEPFLVPLKDGGTDSMMHPCDPSGSAENCINCRCIEIAVMDAPEE